MNTKRCGYSLTEVFVIIVMIVVLMTLLVRPFRTMVSEIPRSARVCRTLNSTQKMLSQLKKDVEQSNSIRSFEKGVLELKHSDNIISYAFSDGKIIRKPGINDLDADYIWQFPYLKMDAKLWRDNGIPYAFELTTWNQQMVSGREQVRFKQTTVFFRKGEKK